MGIPAIRVESLGKKYNLAHAAGGRAGYRTLRESLAGGMATLANRVRGRAAGETTEEFWALKDVSFEVQPGEVVGIIGRNGAGKSTLLKVLSRITKPTTGWAVINGRVGSLLEVGTGFHPELTGRENVYLNGSILGMSRREIDRKFDEIVDFAEVEKFLDTPVKRYSSGMYVRLAFAVAAHLEPEILIVDEVLAVGDSAFQQKCLRRIEAVNKAGRTVLLVSHQLPAIQNFCTRCIYLRSGRVAADAPTEAALQAYHGDLARHGGTEVDLTSHPGRPAGTVPTMRRVRVINVADGTDHVPMGGSVRIETEFEHARILSDITFGLVVKDQYQTPLFGVNTLVSPPVSRPEPATSGRVDCTLKRLPLMPGRYSLDLYFGEHGENFDIIHDAAELLISPADVFGSGKLPPAAGGSIWWPATMEVRTDAIDVGSF